MHQVPTHVWYSAYGRLTALNIEQNERIRAGLHGDRAATRRELGAVAVTLELDDIQGLVARGYGDLRRPLPAARGRGRAPRRGAGSASGDRVTRADDAARRARGQPRVHELRARAARARRRALRAVLERVRRRHDDRRTAADPRRRRRERAGAMGVGRPGARPIDAVLLLYARDDASLARARAGADARSRRAARASRAARHRRPRRLRAVRLPRRDLAADRRGARRRPARPRRPSAPGEFVLGYRTSTGSPTGRCSPTDADAAADEAARRPRPQRQLPRLPPAAAGRARLLAVRRPRRGAPTGAATRTRACGSRRRWSAAGPSGAPLALAPDARRSRASPRRTTSPTTSDDPRGARCPVGAHIRRANPRDSLDPGPAASSSLDDQPAPPDPAPRPRVRPAAAARRRRSPAATRRRARPALHLPEREHRAPVRVRPAHLAEQPEVRRALRRRRPARRAVGAARRDVHDPGRRRPRARDRRAAVRDGEGRRLLLPAGPRRAALPRRARSSSS